MKLKYLLLMALSCSAHAEDATGVMRAMKGPSSAFAAVCGEALLMKPGTEAPKLACWSYLIGSVETMVQQSTLCPANTSLAEMGAAVIHGIELLEPLRSAPTARAVVQVLQVRYPCKA